MSDSAVYQNKPDNFFKFIIISIILHIVVFFIFPMVSKLFVQEKEFKRPETFTLVKPPAPVKESSPAKKEIEKKPQEKEVKQEVKKEEKAPEKKETKPAPETKDKPSDEAQKSEPEESKPEESEEDLNELKDLLGSMSPSVSDINVSEGFEYDWYLRSVMNRVERHWTPPFKDDKLYTVVSFRILASGKVSDVKVTKGSGRSSLDNQAVRAIKLSAPFPKLPPGYSGNVLNIAYTLRPTTK